MKKNLTKFYRLLMCTSLIFGIYSCQTEELNSDENLLTADAKKGNPELNWDCDQDPVGEGQEVALIAGQHTVVGYATVTIVDGHYVINYNITDSGYCLTETHVSVVSEKGDFPHNNGNPNPGGFEYKTPSSMDCSGATYDDIPVLDGEAYFAIHGVVTCSETGRIEDLEASLPDNVNLCVTSGRDIEDAKSYIYMEIAEGALAGNYWAWCADKDKGFAGGVLNENTICYNEEDETFNVYTLNDDLSGLISETDNLDVALYLINHAQDFLDEGYLYGHIQWALWKLLNGQECNSCEENLKIPTDEQAEIKGMEIYDSVLEEGEGYSPACDENTLLVIDDGVNQPMIITIPLPCGDCDETIWAEGCDFPGKNWAMYFQFESADEE